MPSLGGAAKGAAAGAGIGSIIPGVGTAIGAGVGGLIGLFKGGKKKPKPGEADGTDGDPNSPDALLKAGAARKTDTAGDLIGQGTSALTDSLNYFKSLTGNDPAALMEATKPERGRIIDQYDTARQAIGEFGPRGGGSNAASAASRFSEANAIGDLMSGAKREAAGKVADIGTTTAGLGLTAEQLASSDLSAVLQAVLTREGFDINKRGQNMDALGGIGEAAGSLLGQWLGRDKT